MNGHRSSSNSPDYLPLLVAIHTKTDQLPFSSCWNVHVLQNLPPNTSHTPATILNLPINLSCLLGKALVLTSDNLHLIFPPLFSPVPVSQPPGGTFQNHSHERHLYCVFTYIYSLLIKKGICDRQNTLFPCVCVRVYFRPELSSFFGVLSVSFPIY